MKTNKTASLADRRLGILKKYSSKVSSIYKERDGELKELDAKLYEEFEEHLRKALNIYESYESQPDRDAIYSDEKIKDRLRQLGLVQKERVRRARQITSNGSRAPKLDIPDDDILKFLGGEKHQQQAVAAHFKTTTQTIKNKLVPLKAAGKVDFEDKGKGKGNGVWWFKR